MGMVLNTPLTICHYFLLDIFRYTDSKIIFEGGEFKMIAAAI